MFDKLPPHLTSFAIYKQVIAAIGLPLRPISDLAQFSLLGNIWSLSSTLIPYIGDDGRLWVHDITHATNDLDNTFQPLNHTACLVAAKAKKALLDAANSF